MANPVVVIGIDVGGTNTDAVVIDKASGKARVLSTAKTLSTADITSGVKEAIRLALLKLEERFTSLAVQQVNIGTTHFINAVVEGKGLAKVSVIRLCGTASKRLPPFSDFPANVADNIEGSVFLTSGGYQCDGQQITDLDKTELLSVLETLKENGERHIVVSGIFSPIRPDQENEVVDLIKEHYLEASVTTSNSIGKLGLLERENAAILNECIKPLCSDVINGLRASLRQLDLDCPIFLTQNDGTLLTEDMAMKFPLYMIGTGTANAMGGAAFLAGLKDALVLDIGGSTMDTGMLMKGFPRHTSSLVTIGGIRTNFRMLDVISIGLGGGSYVERKGNKMKIGPTSAGYNIIEEAFVFAKNDDEIKGRSITATDIAVAAGIAQVGHMENVNSLPKETVQEGVNAIHHMIADCINQIGVGDRDLPLILIGGGSILVDEKHKFSGVSSIIKPEHFEVGNAVGAALSQVSASVDDTVNLETFVDNSELEETINDEISRMPKEIAETESAVIERVRKEFLTNAKGKALIESTKVAEMNVLGLGGIQDTIKLLHKEDTPLSYLPGHIRIKVKVVAELKADASAACNLSLESLKNKPIYKGVVKDKQTVTATGKPLCDHNYRLVKYQSPNINTKTGEWLLSEYDIECISIGAGILGSGGGGDPHIGKIAALRTVRAGKHPRVITPSKFFSTADKENDLTFLVAFLGVPTVLFEKLTTGTESKAALEAIQDLYSIGKYKNGYLGVDDGVTIKEEEGLAYIDDYKPIGADSGCEIGGKKVAALMPAEVGGMNSVEPLIVGAELDIPILDCDGMGRAFPEVQMFAPFIYGCNCFPSALADDKGRRSVVLKASTPKRLEDCFRQTAISMGGTGGVVLSHFTGDQIMKYTVKHSMSFAWRIGSTIIEARRENKSAVDEMVKCTNGKLLIRGKVSGIKCEISGGFTKGAIDVDGQETFAGQRVSIDIKNEFLLAREKTGDETGRVLACVPNLITVLDMDTAEPILPDELHNGMRVSVVAMPIPPLMTTEKALKRVGPQAFGYPNDVEYEPVSSYPECSPVGPM